MYGTEECPYTFMGSELFIKFFAAGKIGVQGAGE
jgi:hypothetical protein